MKGHRVLLTVVCLATGLPADAQDQPFLFSVTTSRDQTPPVLRVDYDVGVGERTFQSDAPNQPERRIAVQVTGGRWTMIGRVGVVSAGSAYHSSQSGEVLVSLVSPATKGLALAAGGGVLHEAAGTDVLLARVIGGHEGDRWRLHGNLLLQKPLTMGRDSLDLITTVGWARRLTPSVALGVEGLGEDLEGFWDPTEAEGGARILVGPSLHVAPRGHKWQMTATGGPIFHPSSTGLSSGALRDLPPTTGRLGFAFRAGVTCAVF
jgi:hypothetical protein